MKRGFVMNRRYSIIFNSVTGNTRKLAETIREALPQEDCDQFGALEGEVPTSQRLYIGWKSACPSPVETSSTAPRMA